MVQALARSEVMTASESMKGRNKLFIAAPMSGFANPSEYEESRNSIEELKAQVSGSFKVSRIYFAGTNAATSSDFTDNLTALKADLSALRRSDLFLLVYPKPVVTGALVELGVAIERKIPIVILVKNVNDLPYFIRQGNSTALNSIPTIKIVEFDRMGSVPEVGVRALKQIGLERI